MPHRLTPSQHWVPFPASFPSYSVCSRDGKLQEEMDDEQDEICHLDGWMDMDASRMNDFNMYYLIR